jgi:hypothetical protein
MGSLAHIEIDYFKKSFLAVYFLIILKLTDQYLIIL